VFDPGMMAGDPGVVQVNVETGDAADVKVRPAELVNPFGSPAADQFERRA
jgi:hypothetical protein